MAANGDEDESDLDIEDDFGPWDMDYTDWKTDELFDYLEGLNSEKFGDYCERINLVKLTGKDFENMSNPEYLEKTLGVANKKHAIAIARKVADRIKAYRKATQDKKNKNKNQNNEKISDFMNQMAQAQSPTQQAQSPMIKNEINNEAKEKEMNNDNNNNNNKSNNNNNYNNNYDNRHNTQMNSHLNVAKNNNNNNNSNNNNNGNKMGGGMTLGFDISPVHTPEQNVIAPQNEYDLSDDDILSPTKKNNYGNNISNNSNNSNNNDNNNVKETFIGYGGESHNEPGFEPQYDDTVYPNPFIPGTNNDSMNDAPAAYVIPQPAPQMSDDDYMYLVSNTKQENNKNKEQNNNNNDNNTNNNNNNQDNKNNRNSVNNDEKELKEESDNESDISETDYWKRKIVDLENEEIEYEANPYFTYVPSDESEQEVKTPEMPYKEHPAPTLKPMSNRFRTNGPNKYIYPPKNGPFGTCRRLDIDPRNYPKGYDIEDELCNNNVLGNDYIKSKDFTFEKAINDLANQFDNQLAFLMDMGYNNRFRNLRALLRHNGDVQEVSNEFLKFDKNAGMYDSVYVGDTVMRGPDWKWGGQDGGKFNENNPKSSLSSNNNNNNNNNNNDDESGLKGTVRGVRRWHPGDPENEMTSCVVVWEHGLYGNYRFNYKGAYDVKVVDRLYFADKDRDQAARGQVNAYGLPQKLLGGAGGMSISIGDQVIRGQKNWRWGEQDGGHLGVGTITEIYASPSPFEAGAVIAVLWDKDKHMWKDKAIKWKRKNDEWQAKYEEFKQNIDENKEYDADYEIYDDNDAQNRNNRNNGNNRNRPNNNNNNNNNNNGDNKRRKPKHKQREILLKDDSNPHCVKFYKKPRRYRRYKHGMNWNMKSIDLNLKQLKHDKQARNNNNNNNEDDKIVISSSESDDWSEPDFDEMLSKPIPKYHWGIKESYELMINHAKEVLNFVSIDDRCERGDDFVAPAKGDYKSQQGIVLRVEQYDPTRVEPDEIVGDKVWLTWDALRGFRYGYKGKYDIKLAKRGEVFKLKHARIRVGDRVSRGIFWHYGDEDGGMLTADQGKPGTVTCVQHKLRVTGLIVRVRWHRNNHVNQYSWGFRNIFDLKKLKQNGQYGSNLAAAAPAAAAGPGME